MDEIKGAPHEGEESAARVPPKSSVTSEAAALEQRWGRVWDLLGMVESPVRHPRPQAENIIAEAGIRRLHVPLRSEPSRRLPPIMKRHLHGVGVLAVLGAIAASMALFVVGKDDPHAALQPLEFATEGFETNTIRLEDGTEVFLAPGSRLRLEAGSGSVRQVFFEGVGYFSVARDESRPFIIRTAGGTAEVLGTSFELKTSGNEVRIVVVEGRVVLEADGQRQEVIMNQMGHARADQPPSVVEVQNVSEFIAWVDGLLVFQATPLSRVAEKLEEHYGRRIEIEGSILANREVTASLREQTFDPAFTAVCRAVGAVCTVSPNGATMRLP